MLSWWCRHSPRHLTTRSLYRGQLSAKAQLPDYDYDAARAWYKSYKATESLQGLGEVTYSRSRGPGGQNVNKYDSKGCPVLFMSRDLTVAESTQKHNYACL